MKKYLVSINNINGVPEYQIWIDDNITDGNGKAKPTIFKRELALDELTMTISELVKKYGLV